jgi:hypothetical protein
VHLAVRNGEGRTEVRITQNKKATGRRDGPQQGRMKEQ